MSYSESRLPLVPAQCQYMPGSDAIDIWPQFGMDSDEQSHTPSHFEQHQPPQKRPRNYEDRDDNNNSNNQSMNSRMPVLHNVPVNKGISNIFFKTRMCAKFKTGSCRNGESCNFAHGMQDLRQPPPNWQELVGSGLRSEEDRTVGNWEDDQRIIQKMKLCKKFCNGEECPYGDRCNFLHEDPAKFREDAGRYRETATISIGTNRQPMGRGIDGSNAVEVNRTMNIGVSDSSRANVKPAYWKTKLCTKWEVTGHCQFGDKCCFAHGLAELQAPGGRSETEAGNAGYTLTKQPSALISNVSPSKSVSVPSSIEEGQSKKCLLKLKGPKKLNMIYADWPDDLPLLQNLTNQA